MEVTPHPSSMAGHTMTPIDGEEIKSAGRKPIPIVYHDEMIDGAQCVIGTITSKGSPIKFIIDKEDEEKVLSRHWYIVTSGPYVGQHITIEGSRKMLYLHNFVMNRLSFPGKGALESVDHINRNGLDNRKSNLRVVTQSQQNMNQCQRVRRCVLPEGCGITPEDIPKHIWYIKANGLHGERFGIDLKPEGIKWKTTSSKGVSLQEKLKQAKEKLTELLASSARVQTGPHKVSEQA